MKVFLSVALATATFASSAIAGDASSLAPGKPAGVQQAQNQAINPVVYLGLGGIVAVVAIAAGHSSHNHGAGTTTTTTTTTGTSP